MPVRRSMLLAAALALAILAFWRQVEHGVPAALPYVLVVALAYAARSPRWVWISAVVCSLLAIGGTIHTRVEGEKWRILTAALFAIWAPAYPCARALTERTQREHLEGIVNWSGDAIISRTLGGVVTSWNRGAEKLYGYRAEEMLGRPHATIVPPDRQDEVRGMLERLQRGEPVIQYETARMRKNGETIEVSLTISPITNTEGNLVGAATIARDITERRRSDEAKHKMSLELERRVEERTADLARANEALARSNEDLQQFAYVASHDLQTPLRAIAGFAQFLQADYADRLDKAANDYIKRIVRGATRMQELIQDLLEFSRVNGPTASFDLVEMNAVFDEAAETLQASIAESGAKVTRGSLPAVGGDRAQLGRLLENLLDNAIKYRRDDRPEVHVSAVRERNGWTFTVKDNGLGIAPEHHRRIFEIFERLHPAGAYPGTGIGLSLCRKIVGRSGGRIWVEAEEGKGSSFHFTLPETAAPVRAAASREPAEDEIEQTIHGGSKR